MPSTAVSGHVRKVLNDLEIGDAKSKLDAAWGLGTQVTCAGFYEYEAPEGPVIVEFEDRRESSSGCVGDNPKAIDRTIRRR